MKKFLIVFVLVFSVLGLAHSHAATTVPVRAGIHDRYNRLVFDWVQPVKYTLDQNGSTVTIQFDTQASANFGNVKAVNPPFIRDLQQENTAQGLRVTFQIPQESRVQAFWSGQKVAFDVLRMGKGATTFENKPSVESAPVTTATEAPKPSTAPAQESETVKPEVVQEKVEPATTTAATAPQQNPLRNLQTLADALANKPSESVLKNPGGKTSEPPKDNKETAPVTKGTVIRIKPDKLTRMAAFFRADKLWIVIDQAQRNLVPKIEGEHKQDYANIRRITTSKATAFVFDVTPRTDTVYSIRRDGAEWDLWINPADKPVLPPEIPLNITYEKGEEPRVALYAGEQPVIVALKDSSMGDMIWVVPVRAPEGRISKPRRTAAYTMIPTLIGAAVIPQDDELSIGTLNDLVVLSAKKGKKMLLSDEQDRQHGKGEAQLTRAFRLDVPVLEKMKNKPFALQRQELEKNMIGFKDPNKRAEAYIDMARLYIQQGFGAEALGLLRIAKRFAPTVESRTDYRALRGVAAALSGQREIAENDLTGNDIHSQPEAALWLGYARARDYDWLPARAAFVESGDAEKAFPPILQNRLVLAKAEAALEANDIISAEAELKKIKDTAKLMPSERAAHDYIRAATFAATNKNDYAADLYKEVVRGTDQLYRAKSELNLVAQLVAEKELELPEAIERLERLRFSWRGDRIEIDILRQLGQYYIDNKQYMEGLTLWRQAAGLSKNSDDTDRITQRMQEVFSKLYVDGESAKLSPLQALSLYERFRELTPSGDAGNTALRRLADRLASIDLFDQADPLLEDQVLRHSQGEEASLLGAKLAGWRVLNRNPSGALKILDASETSDTISENLKNRRILIRARALADLGRVDEGLALLKDTDLPEGLSLKADINWRQSRWSEAIVALQRLANIYRDEGKNAPDGPIPPLVLKMAIALALDGNDKGLELLAAEYGDRMAKTKMAEAFSLITKPSRGSGLADLETLKGQVGEVELFQKFLKDFGA